MTDDGIDIPSDVGEEDEVYEEHDLLRSPVAVASNEENADGRGARLWCGDVVWRKFLLGWDVVVLDGAKDSTAMSDR